MQHTRGPSSGPHMPQNARRRRTKGVLPRGPPAPPSPLLLGASCPRAYGKIVAYSAGLSSFITGPCTVVVLDFRARYSQLFSIENQ